MDEIGKKYNNMVALCMSIDNTNEWVIWLQTVPVGALISTIKTKNGASVDQLYDMIIETSKFDTKKIGLVNEIKIKRYIAYFNEVSKLV